MKTEVMIIALVTLLSAFGCKTALEAVSNAPATTQVSPTLSPEPTPEPTMPILKKIAEFKRSAPASDSQQLANYANSILPRFGYEYELDLERIIARKIKQHQTKPTKVPGDGAEYVKFDLDVISIDGTKKKLFVVAPSESSCCCGYYYTPISVTKLTPKQLTVVIDSKETVIARPSEIPVVQEYIFGKDAPKPT